MFWRIPLGRRVHLPLPCAGFAPHRALRTACPLRGQKHRSVGMPESQGQTQKICMGETECWKHFKHMNTNKTKRFISVGRLWTSGQGLWALILKLWKLNKDEIQGQRGCYASMRTCIRTKLTSKSWFAQSVKFLLIALGWNFFSN